MSDEEKGIPWRRVATAAVILLVVGGIGFVIFRLVTSES
ncbi:MAG: hypothetical protein JWR07_1148, partial [Nevskia sp.]|nr:hypothetical protein [Nevskia sp.]